MHKIYKKDIKMSQSSEMSYSIEYMFKSIIKEVQSMLYMPLCHKFTLAIACVYLEAIFKKDTKSVFIFKMVKSHQIHIQRHHKGSSKHALHVTWSQVYEGSYADLCLKYTKKTQKCHVLSTTFKIVVSR